MVLAPATWAQPGSRSYVYSGVVRPDQCSVLPQATFEISPSLSRSRSEDRLYVKCGQIPDGNTLLTLTFLLTDTPPPLKRGESRRYSFRWGAKIGRNVSSRAGEFTHNGAKCHEILTLFATKASAKDPKIEPSWVGGCYGEDRWGMAMEITLTEGTR